MRVFFCIAMICLSAAVVKAQEPKLMLPIGHTSIINSVEFSKDGKYVVTASSDNTAKVWETQTGTLVSNLTTHTIVNFARFSPDRKYLVTGLADNSAQLWNVRTGKVLRNFKEKTEGGNGEEGCRSAVFSPDGKYLTIVFEFQIAKMWETETGKLVKTYKSEASVNEAVGAQEKYQIVQAANGVVTIIETLSKKPVSKLTLQSEVRNILHFSKDGKLAVSGSIDSTAKLWEVKTGKLLFDLPDTYDLTASDFSNDGKYIVTASGYEAQIWETATGKMIADLAGHSMPVHAAIFSPDGKNMLTTHDNGSVRIWEFSSGKVLRILSKNKDLINHAEYSNDGKYIVTASKDSTAVVFDAETGEVESVFPATAEMAYTTFSPDGEHVITTSVNGSQLWLTSGKLISDLISYTGGNKSFAKFTNDGKYFYSLTGSEPLVWETSTGNLLTEDEIKNIGLKIPTIKMEAAMQDHTEAAMQGYIEAASVIDISNDGKYIVTVQGVDDDVARVWETATGKLFYTLKGHSNVVLYAKFSVDGKYVATTSSDNTSKVWSMATGKPVHTLSGHVHYVTSANYSADGKYIITTAYDNTVKIWNAKSGGLMNTFFALDSSDYFTQIPSGYYSATQNAARLLHYVTGDLKVITFEQLDIKYNRPDLILQAMGSPDTALIQSYKKAWQKRIKKLGFDTTLFRKGLHVPEADFINGNNIQDQTTNKLSLKIWATDDSVALDRYNSWINEVPIFGVRGISLRSRNTKHFDTTITVTLSSGNNRIETSVTNIGGLESYRLPMDVKYTALNPEKEKLYFIGIGIDHFNDSQYNLNWSVKDIRDLAYNFKEKYGINCIIDTLFDKDVTTENVTALKRGLLKATENDKVIVAYSGHGLLSKEYDYFLSTYNVNFHKPEEGGLPYEAFEDLLDGIPARKKLMLIDACHSGEVDKEEMNKMVAVQQKLDPTKKGVIETDDIPIKGMGMKNSFELMREIFVNVGRGTGATIISAAAGTQFALEKGDLKNGVFSYSILELMKRNSSITISELKKYVNRRVTELTNGMQVPTSREENTAIDWEVW